MVEVNQLAIVNFIGVDRDPESGKYSVYFQIVNPSGLAAQKSPGTIAPIYTYRIDTTNTMDPMNKMLDLIPRKPFFDHYQALVVTERMARWGLVEQLNFLEKQPDRRSTINLIVTDSSIEDIMQTYLPLEKMSGRAIRSIINNQAAFSGKASKKSMVKSLVDNLENTGLTAHPLISLASKDVTSSATRYQKIDANKGNFILKGGALFKQGIMIGKLTSDEMPWFNLMSGDIDVLIQSLTVNGKGVEIRSDKLEVRKKLVMQDGRPVLKLHVEAGLHITGNNQSEKLTGDNLDQITSAFNRQVSEQSEEFFEKGKQHGWDVAGIEDTINRKRGQEWKTAKQDKNQWRLTKLEITVSSTIKTVGITIDPYVDKKEQP
ncbi:hypothetical protein KCTCHS21_59820 [Cohnella abietis]|uniref:Uncharacterized protein n=2 Tax=Cohnella abietis TaxID=2507935 RepID=A0A3T1DER2_9BACL|nr:hypothetical protein KCTCHS21_59820 [Cohnella abietis]